MRLRKALGHLIDHVGQLGLITGLRVLWIKRRGPGHEVTLELPQLAGPVIVRTGTSDLSIFDEVVLLDGYGFQLKEPPATIVDAGANIGLATLWFKKRYPAARIIAVEPDAENYALLQRNVQGLSGVETIRAAIVPTDGPVGWATDGLRHSSFHAREWREGELGVEGISMNTLLQRFGLEHLGLLKLDIEGGEKALFEATDLAWMDRVDTLAVELHDRMKHGCGHAFFRATSRSPRNYDVHEYLVIASKA